jgi:hypothetical protein
MNNSQRLIGVAGALMLMFVALYPRWDVEGTVRRDFKYVMDDNDREDFSSNFSPFHNQERGCLFSNRGEPELLYSPPDERIYDEKKGYSTKSCIGTTLVDYQWQINKEQVLLELLAFLVPSLLLILVFKSPKKKD